jgi:prevent-host-death family protein
MSTVIAASDAKARFSELIDRVGRGESFSITLYGIEAAKLVPSKRLNPEKIAETVAEMKASRKELNPAGMERLKVKDLINEGRR